MSTWAWAELVPYLQYSFSFSIIVTHWQISQNLYSQREICHKQRKTVSLYILKHDLDFSQWKWSFNQDWPSPMTLCAVIKYTLPIPLVGTCPVTPLLFGWLHILSFALARRNKGYVWILCNNRYFWNHNEEKESCWLPGFQTPSSPSCISAPKSIFSPCHTCVLISFPELPMRTCMLLLSLLDVKKIWWECAMCICEPEKQ